MEGRFSNGLVWIETVAILTGNALDNLATGYSASGAARGALQITPPFGCLTQIGKAPAQGVYMALRRQVGARIAWSCSGSMLAMAGAGWGDGARHMAEVHVYDTASGDCLQCMAIEALSVSLH